MNGIRRLQAAVRGSQARIRMYNGEGGYAFGRARRSLDLLRAAWNRGLDRRRIDRARRRVHAGVARNDARLRNLVWRSMRDRALSRGHLF